MKSYGVRKSEKPLNSKERVIEGVKRKGFSIVENYFSELQCDELSNKLEEVYQLQIEETGSDVLESIQEVNVCRSPLLYDKFFLDILRDEWLLDLCHTLLEGPAQLHLQNGIINRPAWTHHQTAWHRDLPYQEFTTSSLLAVNAFICLTEFTVENGAMVVVPYSQHFPTLPIEYYTKENEESVVVPKGSLVLFDSFVYHKAGINSSKETRFGLNHVFTRPFIKQQIDYSSLSCAQEDVVLNELLGARFKVFDSVEEYRNNRLRR